MAWIGRCYLIFEERENNGDTCWPVHQTESVLLRTDFVLGSNKLRIIKLFGQIHDCQELIHYYLFILWL